MKKLKRNHNMKISNITSVTFASLSLQKSFWNHAKQKKIYFKMPLHLQLFWSQLWWRRLPKKRNYKYFFFSIAQLFGYFTLLSQSVSQSANLVFVSTGERTRECMVGKKFMQKNPLLPGYNICIFWLIRGLAAAVFARAAEQVLLFYY